MNAVLKQLQADAAAAMDRAKRQISALNLVAGLAENLRGLGLNVDLEGDEAEGVCVLILTVEIGDLPTAVQALPAPNPDCQWTTDAVDDPEPVAEPEPEPAPEPEPEREAEPELEREAEPELEREAEPKPAPVPDAAPSEPEPAPELVTGPWSDSEKATLALMDAEGASKEDIGRVLGRDLRGVAIMLNQLRKQQAEAKAEPEPDTPAQTVTASISGAGLQLGMTNLTHRQRVVEARLRDMGYPAPWTPQLDLTLVEAICRGDGLSLAAEQCGVDKDLARHRWNAMMPVKDLESRNALASVLRLRVAAAS